MKKTLRLLALLLVPLLACACSQPQGLNAAPSFQLPEKLQTLENGEPALKVYVVDAEQVETMPLEDYLCGVLAGEMRSDWPLEALKAQAILARTFVLKFMAERKAAIPARTFPPTWKKRRPTTRPPSTTASAAPSLKRAARCSSRTAR